MCTEDACETCELNQATGCILLKCPVFSALMHKKKLEKIPCDCPECIKNDKGVCAVDSPTINDDGTCDDYRYINAKGEVRESGRD